MDSVSTAPRLNPLRHAPLHERVYIELRDAIMTARLQPGEAVTLRGLAEELGTSAMPIRDAVHRLVSLRALEVLGNRTVRVPVLLREKFAELTQVRRVLEGAAAEAAAARVSAEGIAVLEESNRAIELAVRRKDIKAAFRENRLFHFELYRAAGNDLLLSMIEDLWLLAGPYLSLPWADVSNKQKSTAAILPAHHRILLKAIKARDGTLASRAISSDIQETALLVLQCPLFIKAPESEKPSSPRSIRLRVERSSKPD